MSAAEIKLRAPTPALLALPWDTPLAEWDPMTVMFRDVPVGPSRHLVRFVEVDGDLLAVKEASDRLVAREYDVLRALEGRGLPAVRPAGTVLRGEAADGLLVTHFLERSWQIRRLFMRLPASETAFRAKLLTAIAGLLVELHRAGVFWGDCSLANTLFVRDGQVIQAHLVDAETSDIHPTLSDGQRAHDLAIAVENITGGLVDIASRTGEVGDISAHVASAAAVGDTYNELWRELHRDLVVASEERWRIARHLERLNELGYSVDEVRIDSDAEGENRLRVQFSVASREHHAGELRRRTGVSVSEGQARILLNDFLAYASHFDGPPARAALAWRTDVFAAGLSLVSRLADATDPVQAFCDLLEVRWLLSERAGRDVGSSVALEALAAQRVPSGTSASLSILEAPTVELRRED